MSTEPIRTEEAPGETRGEALPPLRLLAEDADDLAVISAALQDAVLTPADVVWERGGRRLTVSLNRFCWECGGSRVYAALQFGDVERVRSRGLPRMPTTPLELLALHFVEGEAPGGSVMMMFSGGGDLRVDVECLDAVLADLDQPYRVTAAPSHDADAPTDEDGA